MKKYLFSVIIPVYNVEEYIEETINSVINQTIGFDKIQLILVNDGSTDNSENICLKYKNLYPDNVIYIKQKNSGVSSARNKGLKYASGEYINFLDSDDIWDNDAFKKGYKMFKKYKDICAVIYPLKFFDATDKYHPLHFMFKKDQKVNILKNFEFIKLSSCSTIIKRSELKSKKFYTKLKISEDVRLITEIFLDNPNIGVISSSNYNYRKRITNSSTIQTSTNKKTWYLDTPKYCYKYIIDLSKKKYGRVIEYVQLLLAYDLHWRMDVKISDVLTDDEKKDYLKYMHSLLKEIDDKIIIDCKVMKLMQKLYMLAFKYEDKNIFKENDGYVYVKNTKFDIINNFSVIIDNIVINGDLLDIYGRQIYVPNILEKIYIRTDYGNINFEYYNLDNTHSNQDCLEDKYQYELKGIHVSIDLNKTKTIEIISKVNNKEYNITPIFTYSSILNNNFTSIYLSSDNYFIKYIKNNPKFNIYQKNIKNKIILESKCIYNLIRRRKFKSLCYRILANIYKKFHKKEIWLVSDRIQNSKDNGEAFFKYLMTLKNLPVKAYFVISKKSNDYKKLKEQYGKYIIDYKSLKHKIVHLSAKKIISAQADNYVTNLFGDGKDFVGDLYEFKFVFLQHGITKDDLSPWLNINSKTIDLFVTAATEEYKSITDGNYRYNYPEKCIKLTGFARFDNLVNNDNKNTILIMPTWRKGLVSLLNKKNGERVYDPKFKETDYFKFYNSLINDKRLISYLKKKNYKIRFIPHTNMRQQIDDFDLNDCVEIINGSVNYTEEFANNSLLITDYSSVFFDFCYLNKPVIYAQFDNNYFFENQVYDKGYFSYEKDGFGPVCYDLKDTINNIIKIIDNNNSIEDKYLKRVKKFYKYHDKNNCERIYKEIIKLNNK